MQWGHFMKGKARGNKLTVNRDTYVVKGLTNTTLAAYYLQEAFKEGPQNFLLALSDVVRAHGGIDKLSMKSGMSSKSLTQLLSGESDALLSSVSVVLSALEIRVHFQVMSSKRKTLSDTLIASAKELKFSKTATKKLAALNKPKVNTRKTKISNKNSSKRKN